jgi:hypothetical protein
MRAVVLGTALAAGVDAEIYAKAPTTRLGCECKSACQMSALFECDAQPFCQVKDKQCVKGTAPSSITKGYYDWCEFEAYTPYEQRTAAEKQALILQKANDGKEGSYPSPLGIFQESVSLSFDAVADVFPMPRTKYIHSVGVVGGIKFVSSGDHEYTGLFEGADHGLVRFSSAKKPDSSGFTPGAGVKFFRDGKESANFVAMPSLDGQACSMSNFFAKDFKNHISATSAFALKLVAAKFWQASYCPLMVGVSDLAGEGGKFPYMLTLRPAKGVDVEIPCGNYSQGLANFAKLAVGTALFDVLATPAPNEPPTAIGQIVLTHALAPSQFGDEQLFFKHQYMEDDFALKEEWLEALRPELKDKCGMGCAGKVHPTVDKGCSSPFNPGQVLV